MDSHRSVNTRPSGWFQTAASGSGASKALKYLRRKVYWGEPCRRAIVMPRRHQGQAEAVGESNKPASTAPVDREPSRERVWEMFDRVAPTYDLLNRLLSLGTDRRWRRQLAANLPGSRRVSVLDLATGTADILLELAASGRLESGTGIDMAPEMLRLGRDKAAARGLSDRISLTRGDACRLPLSAESFDAVTVAFGIRNFQSVEHSLAEIMRVLKPGGRLLVLEFSLPANRFIRSLYLLYLRHLLPLMGRIISGDPWAYRYLDRTIETFPHGESFRLLLERAGFANTRAIPQTFGVATLYCGDKPVEREAG